MSGFGRVELERGIDRERLAEFVAALPDSVRGAMNEREVLVRGHALLLGYAELERALQALRRFLVVAGFVLLQPGAERARTAHGAEDRPPDRMSGLGRFELHARVCGERLAELLAAFRFAPGAAVDEGEMAMGEGAVLRAEPHLDRRAQRCRGRLVVAGVEIPQAFGERGLRACFLREFLQLRAARDDEKKHGGRQSHYRNRCWMRTASPDFTSTCATCAGNVELRISILCDPAGSSTIRSGGLRPRRFPSTTTSPHGATASSRRPGASAGFFGAGCSITAAPPPAAGAGSGDGSVVSACARGGSMSAVLSSGTTANAAPMITRNTSGAMTSAERCKPNGPMPVSQPAAPGALSVRAPTSSARRGAGVAPTTAYTSCARTCLSVREPSWRKSAT